MESQMYHYKEEDLQDTVAETPVIPGTALPVQTDMPSGPDKRLIVEDAIGISTVRACEPEYEKAVTDPVAEPTVQISPLTGLEEDPHSPKRHPGKIPPSNYQAKVPDPTGGGGEEVEVTPLLERLGNFHIQDHKTRPVTLLPEQESYTGSHDQFAPRSAPGSNPINPTQNPKNYDQAKAESVPSNTIAGKISSAATAAKDTVASKLGFGGQPQKDGVPFEEKSAAKVTAGEKLGPINNKITGIPKAGGAAVAEGGDRGVSVKEYLVEKLRPGEEDRALSEAIAGRFQTKAGPAVAEDGRSSGGGAMGRLKSAVGPWIGKGSKQAGKEGGKLR